MAAPKGHPRYGGRAKGTPNVVTASVKALAQKYGPEAMAELARLAREAESESARVAAIKELLDRGYGKAAPSPEETEATKQMIVELVRYRQQS